MTTKTLKRMRKSIKTKNTTKLQIKNTTKNKTHLIDEVKLGKQLGKGWMGTVFLAHDKKGNKYAYKIERMLRKDVAQSFKSPYWRENDFAESLANKYPDHFIVLYDSKIEKKCKHQQDYSNLKNYTGLELKMENLDKSLQNHYTKLIKSPFCSVKLWSIIDGNIEKLLIPKMIISKKIFYNLFIQIIYIVFLINNAGYIHNDLHMGNICYIKTDKKTVNILNHNIPTNGYLIKAIDYGLVLHDKYALTKNERNCYKKCNDFVIIIENLLIEWKTEKIGGKEWTWKDEWNNPINISKKEKDGFKIYLPENNGSKDYDFFLIDKLYKLIEWKKWQQQVVGDDTIQGIEPSYLIPLNDILFLVKNIYNPKKILEYFIK